MIGKNGHTENGTGVRAMGNAAQHDNVVAIYKLIRLYRRQSDFTIVNIVNYGDQKHIVEIETDECKLIVLDVNMIDMGIRKIVG